MDPQQIHDWWMRTAARNISQTTAEADHQRDWRKSQDRKWRPVWATTFIVLSAVALWTIVAVMAYIIIQGWS